MEEQNQIMTNQDAGGMAHDMPTSRVTSKFSACNIPPLRQDQN